MADVDAATMGRPRDQTLSEIEAQLAAGAGPHADELSLPAGFQNDGSC